MLEMKCFSIISKFPTNGWYEPQTLEWLLTYGLFRKHNFLELKLMFEKHVSTLIMVRLFIRLYLCVNAMFVMCGFSAIMRVQSANTDWPGEGTGACHQWQRATRLSLVPCTSGHAPHPPFPQSDATKEIILQVPLRHPSSAVT